MCGGESGGLGGEVRELSPDQAPRDQGQEASSESFVWVGGWEGLGAITVPAGLGDEAASKEVGLFLLGAHATWSLSCAGWSRAP